MFANTINDFLFENALYLAMALALIIFILVMVLLALSRKKVKPLPVDYQPILDSLGGISNLISASGRGSRLSVRLKDYQIVQFEKLKTLGVESYIQMTSKLTLLVGEAEKIAEFLIAVHEEKNKAS